jgi:uncharacterized membrane protein YjfL (UPF0719 family)
MRKQPAFHAIALLLAAPVFTGLEFALSAQTPVPLPAQVSLADNLYLIAESFVYILEAFVLLWIAKFAYSSLYRRVELNKELFSRDNHALAVSTVGFYFGILIAFGGAISGETQGLATDVVTIGVYGLSAIVLMLLASVMCEKILLPTFNNTKEVVQDRNLGVGFVEAGVYIANGLIILGASAGDSAEASPTASTFGDLGSGMLILLAFWLLAQVALVVAGRLYELTTPYKFLEELERDNAAVGLAFGGVLVGLGNVISVAVGGDFAGWTDSLLQFAVYVVFGFIMLFLVHKLTDILLASGVKLADEQTQEHPNIGAGLLEAFGYIGASILIVWTF